MKRSKKALIWALILLLLALVVATVILGSVPPVDRDALTHHLFVPKLWLQQRGISEIPEVPFSYYPMNLDLLYTIPLALGNDIIPKYIHYLFALLTGALLYHYLSRRLGNVWGVIGVLFFLSVPIIVKLSITVYVDLGLVFFTTAALLLLLYWAERQFPLGMLILAGLCCGLAAGTKYNGIIAIIALTLLVPLLYQQSQPEKLQSNVKAFLCACVFTIAAITAFAPWLIRNYSWTGNPIYPLHNSLIQKLHQSDLIQSTAAENGPPSVLNKINRNGGKIFVRRKILYGETWWQALLLPIRFFFEGQDDNPQYFDGKLNPFLLILPIFAFLFRPPEERKRREQNILLWFSLLYFFFTFFQETMRIRYIVPIVAPLSLLSIYGLHGLLSTISRSMKSRSWTNTVTYSIALSMLMIMLGYNTQYLINQFSTVNPFPYLQGNISRDQYIAQFRPEYPVIRFMNNLISPNTRVLCLFLGNRGYYMNFHPVFEQPYSSNSILSKFLATPHSQLTVFDTMRLHKIDYILLRSDLFAQWLHHLNEQDRQRVIPLFSPAHQPIWSGQGYTLLNLKQDSP